MLTRPLFHVVFSIKIVIEIISDLFSVHRQMYTEFIWPIFEIVEIATQ